MTNFKLTVLAAASFLLLSMTVFSTEASAQNARRQRYSPEQRARIRAMPILERPSRPGHFYGNAVRRNADSKATKTTKPARQVAASMTPASVNTSNTVSSSVTDSVAADGVTETNGEVQGLLATDSSNVVVGQFEFKSTLASHSKSVQPIEANVELDDSITILLTELDNEQPVNVNE